MTGLSTLHRSVDDPTLSYGEYHYDYDYDFEDLYMYTNDADADVDDGTMNSGTCSASAGPLFDKSDSFEDVFNDHSSIDGPLPPIPKKSHNNFQKNGLGRGTTSTGQVEPTRGKTEEIISQPDPPAARISYHDPPCYDDGEADMVAKPQPKYSSNLKSKLGHEQKNQRNPTPHNSSLGNESISDDDNDEDFWGFLEKTDMGLDVGSSPSEKEESRRRECGTQNSQRDFGQRLLCVHICPNPKCDAAKCRPADLENETRNREKFLKKPSFFYVPVELVLKREKEMRQSARTAKIPENRWNGSLLFRKVQEIQRKQQRQKSTSNADDPVIVTLHPVQSLAQANVISPTFLWWRSWLTVCIRAYYNTGALRIPHECQGLEILLALEFFGILYASPEQLIFDAPHVYHRVKRWSSYFTHRATLAQWIVDQLQQCVEKRQSTLKEDKMFQSPFVFCTNPVQAKRGCSFSLEPQGLLVDVLEGGLDVNVNESLASQYTKTLRTHKGLRSAQLVHQFFVPGFKQNEGQNSKVEAAHLVEPDVVPSMMREDFTSYLQHVLPEMEIHFSLMTGRLVAFQGGSQRNEREGSLLRAVLYITWNAAKMIDVAKIVNSPANLSAIEEEDDKMSSFSAHTSSCASSVMSFGATSISAAPTDEMAFGVLLNDTHKAVSNLLQQSTKEKAVGIRIGKENGFYFHEDTEKSEPLNETLNTTGSSASSSFSSSTREVRETMTITSSTTDSAASEERKPNKENQAESREHELTNSSYTIANGTKEAHRHTPQPQPTSSEIVLPNTQATPTSFPFSVPNPTVKNDDFSTQQSGKSPVNRYGYEPSASQCASVQADHVYADLYHSDCLFPGSALLEDQFQLPAVPTPADSPRPPSSLKDEIAASRRSDHNPVKKQLQHAAPISFVCASSQDQVSVTSSITRQPESVVNGAWSLEQRQLAQNQKNGHYKFTNKPVSPKKAGESVPEHREGPSSGNETGQNDSTPSRAQTNANSGKNCRNKQATSKKSKFGKKKKKFQTRNDARTSLLDDMDMGMELGMSGGDRDAVRQEGSQMPTEESCQLLNDLYDFFVAEDKPSIVLVPRSSGKASCPGMNRQTSLSSQSLGMESASNEAKKLSGQGKSPGQGKSQKKLANNRGTETRGLIAKSQQPAGSGANPAKESLHSGSSSAPCSTGVPAGNGPKPSALVNIPPVTSETVAHCERINGLSKASYPKSEDEEARNGIEVYHVPLTPCAADFTAPAPKLTSDEDTEMHQPHFWTFAKEQQSTNKEQKSYQRKRVTGRKKGILSFFRKK